MWISDSVSITDCWNKLEGAMSHYLLAVGARMISGNAGILPKTYFIHCAA